MPDGICAGLFSVGVVVFRGLAAGSGPAGFPDVDFRFGSFAQAFDVLAVGHYQQYRYDEREDHEGFRAVDFGRYQREDREAAARDHRRERYVVRNHQHHDPHTEAEQRGRGVDARHGAHQRRHALAAAESRENREYVAQHGRHDGADLKVDDVVLTDQVVVLHQFDDRHRYEAFQEVQRKYRSCGPAAQYAQHVGRPGILAAVFADVDAVVLFADPHGARYRAQQIGKDDHRRGGINRKNHGRFGMVRNANIIKISIFGLSGAKIGLPEQRG